MNIYTILISVFAISEVLLLILKRSKTASAKSNEDRKSLLLFWITIPASFIVGGMIGQRGIGIQLDPSIYQNAGIIVFAIGFFIRWLSIFQLGSMFTVDVSISSTHILKTNGLYQIVRHPSYLGLMLIITGVSLFMCNLLSSVLIISLIFLVTNYRISVEEKALTSEFGSQYVDYKKRVKKIVPFIY
jgi:protein-S-isoprenylcysteine O-methyltransferase Ste14